MKKTLLFTLALFFYASVAHSQRIIFESDFENIVIDPQDSIPIGWWKYDVDGINPAIKWAVRDTSVRFCPSCNTRARAHDSRKSLEIPWYAGNGGNFINDDWVWTDSFTVRQGDSLIWWMLIGSDSTFQPYLDTMQVYVCNDQDPSAVIQKLATIWSNLDSNGLPTSDNIWTEHKFDLSQFAGQRVYVAFRYNMNVETNGLWCNIDDLFIGNHSAIGIKPIGSELPIRFALKQNYPNPFNPSTFLEFDVPKREFVSIVLYNSLGQEVRTILNEGLQPGSYRLNFNAGNLPSGTYYYRLIAGNFVETKKMVIVK